MTRPVACAKARDGPTINAAQVLVLISVLNRFPVINAEQKKTPSGRRTIVLSSHMVNGNEGNMAKWRKKPVIIEAVVLGQPMTVETLEGTMRGNFGDYLITGVKGEQYFCKPDIFLATYEPVEDQTG